MKRGMIAICLLSNLAYLQASELEIGERWKQTPEYTEYSKLDPNSQIAKKLKEDTIVKLTNEEMKKYIDSFDVKFRNLMEKKVEELPVGLKGLLGNMNIKIKEELTHNYDSMTISKINTFMFNFVDSIYKDKGTAEKNISELPKIAPELVNSKNISYLVNVGKNYDEAAKSEANAAKSEANAAKSEANAAKSEANAAKSEANAAKSEANAAKWQEIIDILKKMP